MYNISNTLINTLKKLLNNNQETKKINNYIT